MENMENVEEWRDVLRYEGYYQVSNLGRVKRIAGSPYCKKDRILKGLDYSNGYRGVSLLKKGKRKYFLIHRLVLEAFNPIENMEKLQVNHLNEIRNDNRLENLEWVTRSENLNYGNRTKRYIHTRGHKVYCKETDTVYESLREAERETGVTHRYIAECCKGIRKQTKGLHFEYANKDNL